MSSYTGNLYTLRAPSRELLPRTTIFLYGTDRLLLRNTLFNLAYQDDDHLDVIILHDGPISHDNYRSLSEAPHWLPLQLLELEQPRGTARAVNAMLKRIESDFVLILEAGDTLNANLSTLTDELYNADEDTIGVHGDLEWGDRLLGGEPTPSRRLLLSRLQAQTRIAPPLLRRDPLLEIGGLPTDYPSQGWLLPDTALILALLDAGRLAYDPTLCVQRPARALDAHQKQDERALLNVLLRRTAKRHSLPLHLPLPS